MVDQRLDNDGGDVRPRPDPTALTTDAVNQAARVSKDYTDGRVAVLLERLDGIDRATRLLNETVNRVPTDVQREVTHLTSLMDERFVSTTSLITGSISSVQTQFAERDTRQERESRDNKIAVDAAFAAQKEIAAKQDESNARALEKSEKSTEKTIDSLADKIDDLKDRLVTLDARVTKAEGLAQGAQGNKTAIIASIGALGVVITIIVIVANILGARGV
jgi:chromosome segregation ATPase